MAARGSLALRCNALAPQVSLSTNCSSTRNSRRPPHLRGFQLPHRKYGHYTTHSRKMTCYTHTHTHTHTHTFSLAPGQNSNNRNHRTDLPSPVIITWRDRKKKRQKATKERSGTRHDMGMTRDDSWGNTQGTGGWGVWKLNPHRLISPAMDFAERAAFPRRHPSPCEPLPKSNYIGIRGPFGVGARDETQQ